MLAVMSPLGVHVFSAHLADASKAGSNTITAWRLDQTSKQDLSLVEVMHAETSLQMTAWTVCKAARAPTFCFGELVTLGMLKNIETRQHLCIGWKNGSQDVSGEHLQRNANKTIMPLYPVHLGSCVTMGSQVSLMADKLGKRSQSQKLECLI